MAHERLAPNCGGILLALLTGCSAGTIGTLPAAPERLSLLERCAEHHGGWEVLGDRRPQYRRSKVVFFRADAPPVTGEARTWTRRPDGYRLELDLETGEKLVQVYDRGSSREWQNGIDTGRSVTAEVERRLVYQDLLLRLRDLPEPPARVLEVEGRPTWIFELRLAPDRWQLWIDEASAEIRRVVCTGPEGDGVVERSDLLFDFVVAEGGRRVPGRQVTLKDGEKVAESTLLEARPVTDEAALFRSISSDP